MSCTKHINPLVDSRLLLKLIQTFFTLRNSIELIVISISALVVVEEGVSNNFKVVAFSHFYNPAHEIWIISNLPCFVVNNSEGNFEIYVGKI